MAQLNDGDSMNGQGKIGPTLEHVYKIYYKKAVLDIPSYMLDIVKPSMTRCYEFLN